jgi:hypothetical protein
MWGTLSDERTGLSFARVCCQYVQFTFYMLLSVYTVYIQGLVSPGSVQQIMPVNSSDHFGP